MDCSRSVLRRVLGEPQVHKAIAFEEYVEYNVHHEAAEDGPVSRAVQDSGGLGAGAILYGVAFGGLFALVFAAAYGRLGTMTARGTAAVLGLLGFIGVYLVPVLKYPANPPAIGDPDTIGRRTTLFLVMILLSIAAMVIAVVVRRRLVYRFGEWNATLVVGGGYLVAMAVCFVAAPGGQRSATTIDRRGRARRDRCRDDVPAGGLVAVPHRVTHHPSRDVGHDRHRLRRPRASPVLLRGATTGRLRPELILDVKRCDGLGSP